MLQAAALEVAKTMTDFVQLLVAEEISRFREEFQSQQQKLSNLAPSSASVAVTAEDAGTVEPTLLTLAALALPSDLPSSPNTEIATEPSTSAAANEVTVLLWSSEITAYMGNDAWLSRTQALARVWKRTHEPSFRDAHSSWQLRGQCPLLHASVGAQERARAKDPFLGVQTAADVEKFRSTQPQRDVSKLYREKGKLLEEETALLLEKELGQNVELRNAGVFWQPTAAKGLRPLFSKRPPGPIVTPGPYTILGEVDGCLLQEPFQNVPVEFKLRMGAHGVSNSIPFKDIVQVQSYMEMLDAERSLHVQRAFGTAKVTTTIIERDRDLWANKIQPAIEEFVCDIRRLLRGCFADDDFRHTVFRSVEPSRPQSRRAVATANLWGYDEEGSVVDQMPRPARGVHTSPILSSEEINHPLRKDGVEQLPLPLPSSSPSPLPSAFEAGKCILEVFGMPAFGSKNAEDGKKNPGFRKRVRIEEKNGVDTREQKAHHDAPGINKLDRYYLRSTPSNNFYWKRTRSGNFSAKKSIKN